VQGYVLYKGFSEPGFPCVESEASMFINQTMIPFTSGVADAWPDQTACNYLSNVDARIGYGEYLRSPDDCNRIGSCDERPFYIASYGIGLLGREKALLVDVHFEQTFIRSRSRPTIGQCLPYDWRQVLNPGFSRGGISVVPLSLFTFFNTGTNPFRYRADLYSSDWSACDSPVGTYIYEDDLLVINMVVS
jgi:hypothetical protein